MQKPQAPVDHSRSAAGDLSGLDVAALFVAVMVAVAVPVVTHPLPPLSDYVNHLATAHVVDAIAGDPDLDRFYRIDWQPIPNLMMDLVVPVLHRFMDIYLAGEIFTLAILAVILSGTLALNRALMGRWSALPLIAAPLLYNGVLLVGVMNYMFGIGLALWGFAAWIALRERPWPWRLAISALIVLALFFCHLFALGLYGLELLAFELHRLWVRRRAPLRGSLLDFVATGVPFVPALLLLITGPTWDSAGVPAYWDLPGKVDGVMLALSIYYPWVAYVLIAVIVAAAALARYCRALHIHPVGWALLGVGAAVYLALPRVLFAAHLADQRLPIALAFMLIACVGVDLRDRRLRAGFLTLLASALALRLGEVQIVWNDLSRGPYEALRSVHMIARGARVLVVHGDRSSTGLISDLGLLHIASLATIERSALVSTAFTVEGKHILQVRDAFRPYVDARDGTPPSLPYFLDAAAGPGPYYFSDWPHHFDYVFVLFTKPGDHNPDATRLAPVDAGQHFQLYRVIPHGFADLSRP
jgi:MFS family permease